MINMLETRSLGLRLLAARGMRKSAAGEFTLENILNRIFEEYGVERDEQKRIVDAIRNTSGRGRGKITDANATFLEKTHASLMNRVLNTRGSVIRPSLKKCLSVAPYAATVLGVPVLTSMGIRFFNNKRRK